MVDLFDPREPRRRERLGKRIGSREISDGDLEIQHVHRVESGHCCRSHMIDAHRMSAGREREPRNETLGLLIPPGLRRHENRVGVHCRASTKIPLERLEPLFPQLPDRLDDGVGCTGVVEPHVGDFTTLLLGGLRADPGHCIGLRHSP